MIFSILQTLSQAANRLAPSEILAQDLRHSDTSHRSFRGQNPG